MSVEGCISCDLQAGRRDLAGGEIHSTTHWSVSHCVGPLGVGTIILAPKRHVLHVWDLDVDESVELGPLLRRCADVVRELTGPDQIYVCLWSHAGGEPGHIHFVVQPVPQPGPDGPKGPALQMKMFDEGVLPDRDEVAAFCDRARALF
jgi:diadenosine tetraphosphate (Ap4A) HIT family hydrolase